MAFPVVAATATSVTDPAATSHVVALPSGINAGDRVIVAVNRVGNDTPLTWPAGWTQLLNLDYSINAASPGRRLEVRYKDVNGAEGFDGSGDTITLTTTVARLSYHVAARITGFDAAVTPVIGSSTGTGATNPSQIHSPLLDPPWGLVDTLWFSFACTNCSTCGPFISGPTNYTGFLSSTLAIAPIALAYRSLQAETEDPNAFTLTTAPGTSAGLGAATLAIAPLPSVDVGAVMI